MKNEKLEGILDRVFTYSAHILGVGFTYSTIITIAAVMAFMHLTDRAPVDLKTVYSGLPVQTQEALQAEAHKLKIEEYKQTVEKMYMPDLLKLEKILEEDLSKAQ